MNFHLHEDNNLISFLGIPEDASVESIFGSLSNNANQVISEGLAVTNSEDFGWVGSLNEIEADKGYWIALDSSATLEVEALPTNQNLIYTLHDGYNLISYIGYKIENDNIKRRISLILIIFAMFQEMLDYSNRVVFDHLYIISWDQDLPFHLCHFGFSP